MRLQPRVPRLPRHGGHGLLSLLHCGCRQMIIWCPSLFSKLMLARPGSQSSWTRPTGAPTSGSGTYSHRRSSATETTTLLRWENQVWSTLIKLHLLQSWCWPVQGCLQYYFGNGGSGTVEAFNYNQPTSGYEGHLLGMANNHGTMMITLTRQVTTPPVSGGRGVTAP